MADAVNITLPAPIPVTVDVTENPQAVSVASAETPQTVSVAVAETLQAVSVDVTPAPSSPVTVEVAVAVGSAGPPGANAQYVLLANLAAYLALAPEVQMDGRWYLIPKP